VNSDVLDTAVFHSIQTLHFIPFTVKSSVDIGSRRIT